MTIEKLNELKKENKYVLLDFYATWCTPCKLQSEVIHQLQEMNVEGLNIQKVDVDEYEDLANEFNIVSVPTLILFREGEVAKRNVGLAKLEDILQWI